MDNRLAFPMYAVNEVDNQALWQAVKQLLAKRGQSVDTLRPGVAQGNLLTHWRDPHLLLSQTCGYPLVTALPEVQTVGRFHYTAPGCEGANYRSFLIARQSDIGHSLADFRGRRVVCNAIDSQSGYHVLCKMVTSLPRNGAFFAQLMISGSHRQSLIDVARGTADLAAIDCVTYALLARHQPHLLASLKIVQHSPPAPGLPLITAAGTAPETLATLRAALKELVSAAEFSEVCRAMMIGGYSDVTRSAYRMLLDWRNEAAEKGVTTLSSQQVT